LRYRDHIGARIIAIITIISLYSPAKLFSNLTEKR
jgi:hypothetical protein